ncbi:MULTISPECIES: sugar kinase [unclassified Sporolactobacillus]|uniref:sugar kinase n=1 Tax=unclassified Sporolactobacillus TaxID=2628533 RepID=UPI0023674AFE|nr:sugar kinase [Sporolactobacillus sp. CQH2019]MDD9147750.1 sugar kinase [Sporolactobacillus sp. CQH2019]
MPKILALGEILLRLSTDVGELLNSSRQLNANYGGSEANVASILSNFGHSVVFASKLPDSPLGMAALRVLHANQVDTSAVLFGGERIGIYFLEQGNSLRFSRVIYDRKASSICEMNMSEWDLDKLFADVSLFHISGITFALSEAWHLNGQKLVQAAYERGIPVSFDINFRQAMWSLETARKSICPILPMITYCCANYLDAHNFFGIDSAQARPEQMEACYRRIADKYPNIRALYATNRHVFSTSNNELQGILWKDGHFVQSKNYRLFPIVDRIGGGDAFVAGILHGILTERPAEVILPFAMAASLLKHTISGDWISLSARDIQTWLDSPNSEVKR